VVDRAEYFVAQRAGGVQLGRIAAEPTPVSCRTVSWKELSRTSTSQLVLGLERPTVACLQREEMVESAKLCQHMLTWRQSEALIIAV
jgi:hypothetical protein